MVCVFVCVRARVVCVCVCVCGARVCIKLEVCRYVYLLISNGSVLSQ